MKNFFSLLISYAKRHFAVIMAVFIAIVIFSFVFSLYSLPVEAVLYASVLCLFSFGFIFILRFASYYRRHRTLEEMKKNISVCVEKFPAPSSRIEADYQELITLLDESRAGVISQKDKTLTDMTDYYTLWAHQIKTPIAAMRLLLQSEPSGQNDELSEQLFKIEQYVEMVLGYLRTENMSGDLMIKTCPLDDIIKQAVKKYARSFIRKKLTLDYRDLHINVLTDEKWLCFVIEQILSNSLKYTKEGKIAIYTDPEQPVTLVIEDTGIGIQAEDLPRITEKGFTGFNGREDKKSTGIGLYLCKKILEKLSHTMAVESQVGVGTKVKIRFEEKAMRFE